jgi:flagellar protein FliO/FliZ
MGVKKFSVAAGLALSAFLAEPAAVLAGVKGPNENQPLNLPSTSSQHVGSAAGGGSLVRTFVGLAVVLAVIYGLYWVLRQIKSSREERASGSGLRTEASVPLGPNRSLHLVRAGRELVLVGVAEHGVVPIRTYTEAEAQAAGLISPDGDDDRRDDDDGAAAPQRALPAPVSARQLTERTGQLLHNLRAMTVRG